ncbi:MAG: peptide chain release factor N(5)-glutamine methyltransferase [Candidatus Moranbacteria bacterium]|nr:peptide chain release factor N(5)-glutamine methyltransferase [Candidatus Moranbacteria bacterium]
MTVLELQKKSLPAIAPEDFFLLLSHATQKERVFLLAHPEYELTREEEAIARQSLDRRQKHEPVAYITGEKEFYGRTFKVTRDTLIPRPETELLVECALKKIALLQDSLNEHPAKKVIGVDVGTGSGNIILSVAQEAKRIFPQGQFTFFGLDISSGALAIAKENALRHHQEKEIIFLESNLLENFSLPKEKGSHLLILANLPYLSEKIYTESDPTVRCFEPKSALESGFDGLDHYRKLLQSLASASKSLSSCTLFLEISPEQKELIATEITTRFSGCIPTVHPDLAGRARIVEASLP